MLLNCRAQLLGDTSKMCIVCHLICFFISQLNWQLKLRFLLVQCMSIFKFTCTSVNHVFNCLSACLFVCLLFHLSNHPFIYQPICVYLHTNVSTKTTYSLIQVTIIAELVYSSLWKCCWCGFTLGCCSRNKDIHLFFRIKDVSIQKIVFVKF